jgi:sugar/nucleoside kinase (ribokinase family)
MSRRSLGGIGVLGSIVNDTILELGCGPLREKTLAASEHQQPGGFAANVREALAQLELPNRLVGLVGPDDRGLALTRQLEASGPDAKCLPALAATRSSFILRQSGRDSIVTTRYPIANAAATLALAVPVLAECSWVMVGPGLPEDLPFYAGLIETLAQAGKRVYLVLSKEQLALRRDVFYLAANPAVTLQLNAAEAEVLCGTRHPEAALGVLAAECVRRAVITTPEAVYGWAVGSPVIKQPARESGTETSRSATGDTFAAVMVAGLSRGLAMQDAIPLATAAAAIYVRDGRLPAYRQL